LALVDCILALADCILALADCILALVDCSSAGRLPHSPKVGRQA